MTYAIGEFKYGLNFKDYTNQGLPDEVVDDIRMLEENETLESSYNGSGDQPLYLAVEIDDIDECNDLSWTELVALKDKFKAAMAPDSNQHKEYLEKLQVILDDHDVSDETKEWFKAQTPAVFLTWGSS